MLQLSRPITAPAATVWNIISDLPQWAEQFDSVDEIVVLDPAEAIAVEQRFSLRRPGLALAVHTISDWRPGAEFTWFTTRPGARTTTTYRVTSTDTGSTLAVRVVWSGRMGWAVRLIERAPTKRLLRETLADVARLANAAA